MPTELPNLDEYWVVAIGIAAACIVLVALIVTCEGPNGPDRVAICLEEGNPPAECQAFDKRVAPLVVTK